MSKTVKTVVQVASIAAGAWGAAQLIGGAAGGGLITGGATAPIGAAETGVGLTSVAPSAGGLSVTTSGAAAATQAGIGSKLAAVGKGLLESKALQVASTGMQGLSFGMQQVARGEAQDAQKEQERIQAKILERQEQKARVQQLRQERIQREGAVARAANVGGGTAPQATIAGLSPLQGGLGALGMQSAENQQEIRFGASAARAVGATAGDRYSAESSQQGWSDLGRFGSVLKESSPGISAFLKENIFA